MAIWASVHGPVLTRTIASIANMSGKPIQTAYHKRRVIFGLASLIYLEDLGFLGGLMYTS